MTNNLNKPLSFSSTSGPSKVVINGNTSFSSRSFSTDSVSNPFKGLVNPVVKYFGLGSTSNLSALVKVEKGKAGVYCIVNTVNGKFYVGSSVNMGKRFTQHFITHRK